MSSVKPRRVARERRRGTSISSKSDSGCALFRRRDEQLNCRCGTRVICRHRRVVSCPLIGRTRTRLATAMNSDRAGWRVLDRLAVAVFEHVNSSKGIITAAAVFAAVWSSSIALVSHVGRRGVHPAQRATRWLAVKTVVGKPVSVEALFAFRSSWAAGRCSRARHRFSGAAVTETPMAWPLSAGRPCKRHRCPCPRRRPRRCGSSFILSSVGVGSENQPFRPVVVRFNGGGNGAVVDAGEFVLAASYRRINGAEFRDGNVGPLPA